MTFLMFFVIPYVFPALLQYWFFAKFTQSVLRVIPLLSYLIAYLALTSLELRLQSQVFYLPFFLASVALLAFMGQLPSVKACSAGYAVSVALLTHTVTLLCHGFTNPILILLAPYLLPERLNAAVFTATVLPLLLQYLVYLLILRFFPMEHSLPRPYLAVFLIPLLLFFLIEKYILLQVYGSEVIIEHNQLIKPIVANWQILLIQLFCILTLFCILHAAKRLTEDFSAKSRTALLKQELRFQRENAEDAKTRLNRTRAFRHDIQNHLTVLDGLLRTERTGDAVHYLEKLNAAAMALSPECPTGSAALDALLSSKLEIAKQEGILTDIHIQLPNPCFIDEPDLCVIFANALDNARKACGALPASQRKLRVTDDIQGDFYLLRFENPAVPEERYPKGSGIGLSSIAAAAERYGGTIRNQQTDGLFVLSLLFIHSQPKSGIPLQSD